MSHLWRMSSLNLTMFTIAKDYKEACRTFKMMLTGAIMKSDGELLIDELIEVSKLDTEGRIEDAESGLEFSEEWLRDLGLGFRIINLV